jgi:hypothetical protein
MDNFKREILVLSKRKLAELRGLDAALLGVQKQIESIAEQNQTKDEREKARPVIPAELYVPDAEKAQAKRTKTEEKWSGRWKLLVETFTCVAVVVYALFAARQWCEMRKAVKSAEDANNIARDTLTANQRAYVTVSGLDIQPVPGEPAFWRALPVVVNNGNTSTKNMWWTGVGSDARGYLYWLDKTIDKPQGPLLQTFKDLQAATRNTMSLGPRQENHSLSLSTPIPVQYINGIKARTTKLYIHGVFFYQDFLSLQGHITRYCYTL